MPTFNIWFYAMNNLETFKKKGQSPSWVQALLDINAILTKNKRAQLHVENAKEIHIILTLDDLTEDKLQRLPSKIFMRKACADLFLTSAESNVMMQLMEESDNEVIASHLNISAQTVHTHRKNIFHKLSVHDLGSARYKITQRATELMQSYNLG